MSLSVSITKASNEAYAGYQHLVAIIELYAITASSSKNGFVSYLVTAV